MYVSINQETRDTLVRQSNSCYSGKSFVMTIGDSCLYLVERNTRKGKKTHLVLANELTGTRIMLLNSFAMWNKDIYNRYIMTKVYLQKSSHDTDSIVNALNELEKKLVIDEQSFLVELKKFETEYLYREIAIEE